MAAGPDEKNTIGVGFSNAAKTKPRTRTAAARPKSTAWQAQPLSGRKTQQKPYAYERLTDYLQFGHLGRDAPRPSPGLVPLLL